MTGIAATNSINNFPSIPVYNNNTPVNTQGSVAISTPQGKQIYNYPTTSLYNDPTKQSASGLNIYVFNPSGIGAPSTVNNNTYGTPQNPPAASAPISNTPISGEPEKDTKPAKTKNVVKLTNDYIKTLESFLRSQDKTERKQGIQDLIQRFEEDESRYDNPSLTALLNIALQDPDVNNRMIALSAVASSIAKGDKNTIALLNELKNSQEMYGQEAKIASNALLKSSQIKEKIADDSTQESEQHDKK